MPLRRSTPPVAAPCTAGAIHTGKATREWKCGTRGLGGGEPGPVPRICKFLGRLSSFCHARVQCSYTVIGVHAFRKLCYLSNEDAGTRIRGVPPAPASSPPGRRGGPRSAMRSAHAGGSPPPPRGRPAGRAGGQRARHARVSDLFCATRSRAASVRHGRPPPAGATAARRASGRATRRARRSPFGFLSCGDPVPDRSSIDYRAALLCVNFP